mmetsp:Transcript_9135/g.22390  ORF Transcript_9135/g.22390 Transcript_9135/m.22390 type:complete len:216 (+) Transcript_9135:2553-3200(+)
MTSTVESTRPSSSTIGSRSRSACSCDMNCPRKLFFPPLALLMLLPPTEDVAPGPVLRFLCLLPAVVSGTASVLMFSDMDPDNWLGIVSSETTDSLSLLEISSCRLPKSGTPDEEDGPSPSTGEDCDLVLLNMFGSLVEGPPLFASCEDPAPVVEAPAAPPTFGFSDRIGWILFGSATTVFAVLEAAPKICFPAAAAASSFAFAAAAACFAFNASA